jgi:prepilin-type N-terminal cleavage/methylation domain-containing protein
MKGFTLIEVIIVISLISALTLIGITKFSNLREDTMLTIAVDEFASNLRTARIKSMSGEIDKTKAVSDYEPHGLPVYGIETDGSEHKLFVEFISIGEETATRQYIDRILLDAEFAFSGSAEVGFKRISGQSPGAVFILENTVNSEKQQISIDSVGVITITKI